jgi:hypothetical protein
MIDLLPIQHNQRMRIAPLWAKLLRRLMALPDGEYYMRLEVSDGRVNWRFLTWGKAEGVE